MKNISLNPSNDIYTSHGNLAISEGVEAIAQACQCAIRTLRGELALNVDEGIPYFDVLYTNFPNLDLLKAYMMENIQKIDGVIAIKSINFDINGEKLNYVMEIKTTEGEATING